MYTTKILIADDHAMFRDSLSAIISNQPDLEIFGEAVNGRDAVDKAKLLVPDLILMDLTMPIMNGTEAIRIIKQRLPHIKILALTGQKSRDHVLAAMNAGANGYVLKEDPSSSLFDAISLVMRNKVFLSAGICDTVLSGFLGNVESLSSSSSWHQLTVREREVIKLVAEGYKNREIAAQLKLSIKTIEKHRSSLMNKLGVHGTSALTTYAIEHSLVSI